jgi:hypothetical protein
VKQQKFHRDAGRRGEREGEREKFFFFFLLAFPPPCEISLGFNIIDVLGSWALWTTLCDPM